jgi:glycosyltransferase involved in cell wall biosynthesis
MVTHHADATAVPLFSIIIPVFNHWAALDRCLGSISEQVTDTSFEVVIVDDGSAEDAPENLVRWGGLYPLKLIRQSHAGISSARNRGVQSSRGSILLFVDADCRLRANCLGALDSRITESPQHRCFQLHLVGDCSRLVGKSEELRLITIQEHTLQPDGRIRYLNTAAFAIRQAAVDTKRGLFDAGAVRAEDTLLLAKLMQSGELPLFVPDAIVEHAMPLSSAESLHKEIRSAYLESKTYKRIAGMGVRIRVGHRQRLKMLASMWKTSGRPSIGRAAWFLAVTRQVIRRTTAFVTSWL